MHRKGDVFQSLKMVKENRNKNFRVNLIKIAIALILTILIILPSLLLGEEFNMIYIFATLIIGILIGHNIAVLFFEAGGNKEKVSFRTKSLIIICTIGYVFIGFLIDLSFFSNINNISLFFLKVFLGVLVLYAGFRGIVTKRMFSRGGQLTKKHSVFEGWLFILFSLLILSLNFFLSFKD